MLLAEILAGTLVAFNTALLVGLHKPEGQDEVQALNYPVTLVHKPGESWAVRNERDENA